MKPPIINMLKKREYRELASFQDDAVDILYQTDNTIIMHGGTAIWRCYGGGRFSNDIDIYLTSKEQLERLKESISRVAPAHGVKVEKIKDTGNLVFIGLSINGVYMKVEINYTKTALKPILQRFEKVDGTYTEILTLSPGDLILEKIEAYTDRRFIRDIYDIYILSNYADAAENTKLKPKVLSFLNSIAPPVNEEGLVAILYSGPIPSFDTMVKYIRGRFA